MKFLKKKTLGRIFSIIIELNEASPQCWFEADILDCF